MRRETAILAWLLVAPVAVATGGAAAGVRYGDAVPGVIHPSDIERIRRILHLDRFSIIAAVRLGAAEGREAILAEPLPDETLKRVKDACEAGGFCPDPVGFVASRVLIVLLQDKDVETVITVQKEARGGRGRLVDLRDVGVEGEVLGWNGRPETFEGHIALSLTPLTAKEISTIGPGLDPPLRIRFNPDRGRFQVYDCVAAEGGQAVCDFREETGD